MAVTFTRKAAAVSIHAPVRGATRRPFLPRGLTPGFNPRPRAGGDSDIRALWPEARKFQSTPPCGGRPDAVNTASSYMTVSIHAPVRGATGAGVGGARVARFQSTPPCGGRRAACRSVRRHQVFQSTPPCGGRPIIATLSSMFAVSIHAPVRGATYGRNFSCMGRGFQSTPPCGGRRRQPGRSGCCLTFQSTPPCGGRHALARVLRERYPVSIHAPVRGATCRSRRIWRGWQFQSTPPCGGRPSTSIC